MPPAAPKLADFHDLHEACGSIVDIKPGRGPSEDGHHALFAWCPACGATSREIVDLTRIDAWLESGATTAADGSEFARAILKARQRLTASTPSS